MRFAVIAPLSVLCMAAHMAAPKEPEWFFPILGVQLTLMVFMVKGFLADDKKLMHKRKEELRTQRIRELEKELGFTPLELGDPTVPVRKEQP